MIYECPQCNAPQEAGVTSCPHCHAQFDGPVPDDAILPPPEAAPPAEAAPSLEARAGAAAAPESASAIEEEQAAPALEEVKPPPLPPSYVPPSAYVPPPLPYAPPTSAPPPPMRPPLGGLTRALLFAFPIVLVLVLGGVYFAGTLNSQSEAVSTPAPAPPAPVVAAAPVPVGSPVYLQGGANSNSADTDARTKLLVGRWEAKSLDFYVFKENGTGSRGNVSDQSKDEPFGWGLVQNRLMLYMDNNEMLRFNPGPDDDTIFLGPQTGHYVQYHRAKT